MGRTLRGLAGGSKVGKHHTAIPMAVEVIKAAKALACVSKVLFGEIRHIKNGPPRIKFVSVSAGWRVLVRGANSRQELFVYTSDREQVRQAILSIWTGAVV
ncbi:MAG: hypothetical protein AAB455_03620 [Patescibacteria group bacterium]